METSNYYTADDGTQLWYGTVGSGPALILCDGFACDGFIWPYVIDHFHESHTIVRWHYRGHGNSGFPAHADNVSIERLCTDLAGIMGELEIENAVLLGHSMGVQVILQFYGLFPEKVRALVPLCGTYKHPLDTFHNNDRLHTMLPLIDRIVNAAPDQLQTIWETLTPSRFSKIVSRVEINARLLRQKDFLPYLEHVAGMNLQVFVTMLKELAEHSTEAILPKIEVPTLIIAGERDTFTPLHRSEEMAQMIPGNELLVVPAGSHVAPLELPDLVNGAIEKFLRNRLQ